MKIKDIVQENADASTTSSSNVAVVQSNLFAKPIKRMEPRTYGNTPKPAKYTQLQRQITRRLLQHRAYSFLQ